MGSTGKDIMISSWCDSFGK